MLVQSHEVERCLIIIYLYEAKCDKSWGNDRDLIILVCDCEFAFFTVFNEEFEFYACYAMLDRCGARAAGAVDLSLDVGATDFPVQEV